MTEYRANKSIRYLAPAILLLMAVVFSQAQTAVSVDVYDGFDSPTLSDLWDTRLSVPGAVSLESTIVRVSHGAVRVDLHIHDNFRRGKDDDPDTERDEIMKAHSLAAREDTPYEYSWSLYLPPDFPIVPFRLVVAQWKQNCMSHAEFVA